MKSNTKNAKGSGTIRKRSDGRWEARYTTGIDPKTGKQIQKSVYGKTQKEVRQKLTEVTAEIDSGTYLEQTKDTVGEWLDTWLKTYALYSVKSYTYDAYERSCNIHIKPALGRIRLSALTAPQKAESRPMPVFWCIVIRFDTISALSSFSSPDPSSRAYSMTGSDAAMP